MLTLLNEAIEDALNDGFTGLRAAGEMTWILADAPGTENAIEYEALMNEFYPKTRALGLCLYHRSRFSPDMLHEVLRTHPGVVVDRHLRGNPFYEPPQLFFKRCSDRERFDHRIGQLPLERLASPKNPRGPSRRPRRTARRS
jgi:hypothetical protein